MAPRFVIIGNDAFRRAQMFQDALTRLGLPRAEAIPYTALLETPERVAEALRPGDILRWESPGEDMEAVQRILERGAEAAQALGEPWLDAATIAARLQQRGLITSSRQRYLGFRALLRDVQPVVDALGAHTMNAQPDVEIMFDKLETTRVLVAAGVPTPRPLGTIEGYDALRALMDDEDEPNVFIKPRHGSSASGVVALRTARGRAEAITSARMIRRGGQIHLFNCLQIQRYRREQDLRDVIDTLARDGVVVEAWVPKARAPDHRVFDLRMVVIDGRARHVVVRTSRSPMTNLHLGNARGDAEALRAELGAAQWTEIQRVAERALEPFSRTLYAGVDVLVPRQTSDAGDAALIIEANAFGDLLPRVLVDGEDTYTAEIRAMLARVEDV